MPNLTIDPQPEPSASSDPAPVNPPPHNLPKALILGLTLFVLLSVTAYGAYWYTRSYLVVPSNQSSVSNVPSESSQPKVPLPSLNNQPTSVVSEEVAGWKTYTNTKYLFSLKFPEDWEFQESEGKLNGTNISSLALDLAQKGKLPPPGNIPFISVSVTETTDHKYFSLYQWTTVTNLTTVDGATAEERKHKTAPNNKEVVFIKGEKTYVVASENYERSPEQNKIFDQILSTFKFL